VTSSRLRPLTPAGEIDAAGRLWQDLPGPWRGTVIGPGIADWDLVAETGRKTINLAGLPAPFGAELAWMAHWQLTDGTRVSSRAAGQLAGLVRRAAQEHHPIPASMREMGWEQVTALLRWSYAARGKFPPRGAVNRLRILVHFPRLALIARCHDGAWWELDDWHPRCDRRIPLTAREPQANYGCCPGKITQPWLRTAAKWQLGTLLEAGVLRWTTVSQERIPSLQRFSRWLGEAFTSPQDVLGDPAAASGQAAAFRRWDADPANRSASEHRRAARVHPRLINDDLRAVGELFAFLAASPAEARAVLGRSPFDGITQAHADSWFRQVTRIPHQPLLSDRNYVDDHALAQITAALPLLGLARGQHMQITQGDGQQVTAEGFGDPQAMRMILLQILTGRRASEIRTCDFDCLSPVPAPAAGTAGGEQPVRFTYAQSKIDIAPDSILVDREVAAIIAEQQAWVRQRFPAATPSRLFVQPSGNQHGAKPYPQGSYSVRLREFSSLARILDSTGRPVLLSHTHRFRHTRLTRLAELGLPIHVLQRYAGHATPSMSMHYIAQREEHAEQAFLATVKLRADGSRLSLSREDHDSLHLLDRADRFLPNGWCLLPPLQTCDKGNACLTCSVFATDQTHLDTLTRQLTETGQLIDRAAAAFEQRHGHPMPAGNVWLAARRAERDALTRLLAALQHAPGRAVEGAGCGSAPAGPVPLAIDLTRHRRHQP
jgi:Phage integrase family